MDESDVYLQTKELTVTDEHSQNSRDIMNYSRTEPQAKFHPQDQNRFPSPKPTHRMCPGKRSKQQKPTPYTSTHSSPTLQNDKLLQQPQDCVCLGSNGRQLRTPQWETNPVPLPGPQAPLHLWDEITTDLLLGLPPEYLLGGCDWYD